MKRGERKPEEGPGEPGKGAVPPVVKVPDEQLPSGASLPLEMRASTPDKDLLDAFAPEVSAMGEGNPRQIRNSTAEFLIFTKQSGEKSIEVMVEGESVWLTQKQMAALFDVSVPTINEHLSNLYDQGAVSYTHLTLPTKRIV